MADDVIGWVLGYLIEGANEYCFEFQNTGAKHYHTIEQSFGYHTEIPVIDDNVWYGPEEHLKEKLALLKEGKINMHGYKVVDGYV